MDCVNNGLNLQKVLLRPGLIKVYVLEWVILVLCSFHLWSQCRTLNFLTSWIYLDTLHRLAVLNQHMTQCIWRFMTIWRLLEQPIVLWRNSDSDPNVSNVPLCWVQCDGKLQVSGTVVFGWNENLSNEQHWLTENIGCNSPLRVFSQLVSSIGDSELKRYPRCMLCIKFLIAVHRTRRPNGRGSDGFPVALWLEILIKCLNDFPVLSFGLILFTGGKQVFSEYCEDLPWRALQVFAFEGSVQQGFSLYNSSLSVFSKCVCMRMCECVWVCHRPLPLLVGILPSLWGGDLFRFNRWELGLALNLLHTL